MSLLQDCFYYSWSFFNSEDMFPVSSIDRALRQTVKKL